MKRTFSKHIDHQNRSLTNYCYFITANGEWIKEKKKISLILAYENIMPHHVELKQTSVWHAITFLKYIWLLLFLNYNLFQFLWPLLLPTITLALHRESWGQWEAWRSLSCCVISTINKLRLTKVHCNLK